MINPIAWLDDPEPSRSSVPIPNEDVLRYVGMAFIHGRDPSVSVELFDLREELPGSDFP